MDRRTLIQLLENYSSPFQEEQLFKSHFLELLRDANAFQRTYLPGHITGSAWVVNSDASKTLLVHHAKLNKWVQPGGHADGDENVLAVAMLEAEEETGIVNFKIDETIFDIDIHTIPAREDFPQHLHYDIRFLFHADENEPIIISEESHDVRWIPIDQLRKFTTERSVLRMSEKLTQKSR